MSIDWFYAMYLPFPTALLIAEFAMLHAVNGQRATPLSLPQLAWRVLVALIIGCTAALLIGYAVLFGPEALTKIQGLTWLTMWPALAITPLVAGFGSYWIGRKLVLAASPVGLKERAL